MNPTVIHAENLTRRFGPVVAVDRVSMSIEAGDIFGFLGPNGSGKTTLIRMLCGILRPSEGTARVLGYDIVRDSEAIKANIGYMSQQFSLYTDLTVMENLWFYAAAYGIPRRERSRRIEEVIEVVGIGAYRKTLAGQLSGGWRQRLALACALVHKPKLMFLDEPTAGIDPVARRKLWDLLFALSAEGITFFVTTHYMDEAERCTHVGYIYFSRLLVCGTPSELKSLKEVTPTGYTRLEVRCARLANAKQVLMAEPFVRDATIFADALHVLVKEQHENEVALCLRAAGFTDVAQRSIPPTLEDVFVTLTRLHDEQRRV
jgi:ABC-type multidrug transport system ATPase subunit